MSSHSEIPYLSQVMGFHAVIKFMSGDVYIIETFNGFNMGNLLRKVTEIMEKENGEVDFNCERILFYNKDHERIDFMDSDVLNNGDYFNLVIVDEDQLAYVHRGYWDDQYAQEYEERQSEIRDMMQ